MTSRSVEVDRLRKRLYAQLGRVSGFTGDAELMSDYAKYSCVLVSGFLECAIYEILLNYIKTKASPGVIRYVESQLSRFTSPTSEKICGLLGSFDSQWRSAIESYLVDEKKEAVNSLVGLRHKIAHGESVGTTFFQIEKYFKEVDKLVDQIELIVVGN